MAIRTANWDKHKHKYKYAAFSNCIGLVVEQERRTAEPMHRHKKISSPATYRAARIRKLHFELNKEKNTIRTDRRTVGATRGISVALRFYLGYTVQMLTTTIITIASAGYRLAEQGVTQVWGLNCLSFTLMQRYTHLIAICNYFFVSKSQKINKNKHENIISFVW